MDNTIRVLIGGTCGLQYRLWLLRTVGLFKRTRTKREIWDWIENLRMWLWLIGAYVYCICLKSCRRVQAHLTEGGKSRCSPATQSGTCRRSASSRQKLILGCLTKTEHKHPAASRKRAEKPHICRGDFPHLINAGDRQTRLDDRGVWESQEQKEIWRFFVL